MEIGSHEGKIGVSTHTSTGDGEFCIVGFIWNGTIEDVRSTSLSYFVGIKKIINNGDREY